MQRRKESDAPYYMEYAEKGQGRERRPVIFCGCCGEGIYAGENYFLWEDEVYCLDCLKEMEVDQLLEILGITLCEAGNNEREESI